MVWCDNDSSSGDGVAAAESSVRATLNSSKQCASRKAVWVTSEGSSIVGKIRRGGSARELISEEVKIGSEGGSAGCFAGDGRLGVLAPMS